MKKIGFIGLGRMGGPMARNLLKAGFPLTGYDIVPEKIDALAKDGGVRAESLRELALGSEVIVSMLASTSQVREVYLGDSGILDSLPSGSSIIDMSTIDPEVSREIAREAEAKGIRMLDAPVSGSVGAAASGTLAITVGGDEDVLKRNREILEALGSQVFYMGAHGMGLCMKLVTNHMLFLCHCALAESLTLGERMGLEPRYMVEVMTQGAVPRILEFKGYPMAEGDFTPRAPTDLILKDDFIIAALAERLKTPIPLLAAASQLHLAASARGFGEVDVNSVIEVYRSMAGEGRPA